MWNPYSAYENKTWYYDAMKGGCLKLILFGQEAFVWIATFRSLPDIPFSATMNATISDYGCIWSGHPKVDLDCLRTIFNWCGSFLKWFFFPWGIISQRTGFVKHFSEILNNVTMWTSFIVIRTNFVYSIINFIFGVIKVQLTKVWFYTFKWYHTPKL